MKPWLSSCFAISLLFSGDEARANPSAHLVYIRGPGADVCPNEDAVREAVAKRLGYDPFFLAAPTTIFVDVSREGARFVAQVKLIDSLGIERGSRHLTSHGGRCDDLIGTLALTISLVVDPLSLAVAPVVPPAPQAEASDAPPETPVQTPGKTPIESPAAPATAELPKPRPSPSSESMTYFAGLSLLGSLGAALAPTAGANVFGGARWRSLSLRAEGRLDLPAGASNPAAQSWAFMGSALGCGHLTSVFLCALAGFESIWATGQAAVPRNASTVVALGGVRLGAEIATANRFALVPFIEAIVPIPRPNIQIDGSTVHEFWAVAADLGIGGLARF